MLTTVSTSNGDERIMGVFNLNHAPIHRRSGHAALRFLGAWPLGSFLEDRSRAARVAPQR